MTDCENLLPGQGYYCPNGITMTTKEVCYNSLHINKTMPYTCANGDHSVALNGPITQNCKPVQICPYSNPLLCASGACVENPTQCPVVYIYLNNYLFILENKKI